VQAGADDCLDAADATGATPSQLANDKGHHMLATHLDLHKVQQVSMGGKEWGVLDLYPS
jgi:hypothetical protein